MFSCQAIATDMIARRRAFLALAEEKVTHTSAKEWLLCQPFIRKGQTTSLFGPVVSKVCGLVHILASWS